MVPTPSSPISMGQGVDTNKACFYRRPEFEGSVCSCWRFQQRPWHNLLSAFSHLASVEVVYANQLHHWSMRTRSHLVSVASCHAHQFHHTHDEPVRQPVRRQTERLRARSKSHRPKVTLGWESSPVGLSTYLLPTAGDICLSHIYLPAGHEPLATSHSKACFQIH